jgi:fumarylacetoacetase
MTWLGLADDDPFGLANLPYCSFGRGRDPGEREGGGAPSQGRHSAQWLGVRVGSRVLNISGLESLGLLDAGGTLAGSATLNSFMAMGRPTWTAVRSRLTGLLSDAGHRDAVEPLFFDLADVWLDLPFEVADYVDFYSSEHHATNVGRLFRPGQPPLPPNWKHLPIGYHGRAGTVVVSGTPVVRPCGQRKPPDQNDPVYGPSRRLDIEAEVGFVVGVGSALGEPVPAGDLSEHVFGVVLLNDWSARDIQAWEYVPLGPFLGKSFATSISPWVVPLDALAAARVAAPVQDPPVLPYLVDDRVGYDIRLAVEWNGTVVSRPPFRTMYWTPAQQLAHLTVNGACLRTGDLFASGTVSGPRRDESGSLLELTRGGREPVEIGGGRAATFLEDGDTVTFSAVAPGPGGAVIGFGCVSGTVSPSG